MSRCTAAGPGRSSSPGSATGRARRARSATPTRSTSRCSRSWAGWGCCCSSSRSARRSWSRSCGCGAPSATRTPAFLAGASALLVHAGIDWDWEMPALFLWFFAASGMVLAAARAAGGAVAGAPDARGRRAGVPGARPHARAHLPQPAPVRAQRARAVRGRLRGAPSSRRSTASTRCPRAPSRSRYSAYCDAKAGQHRLAVRAMEAARERDPDNWVYAYGLAVTQALAGRDPAAAIADARRLEPARRARGRARARPAVAQPGAPPPGGRARGDPVRVERARMRDDGLRAALRGRGAGPVRLPRLPHRRPRARRGPAGRHVRARAARAPRLRPPARAERNWLYAIALNLLRDHARRAAPEGRAVERAAAGAPARPTAPDDAVEHRDVSSARWPALAEEEREAIALRFGAELTVPEIAEALGEPLTTVEGRVYRALRKLRSASWPR